MLEKFNGETFVAYTDISGFKVKMKQGNAAREALKYFYKIGYEILAEQNNQEYSVDGFFISDCGILFVREINKPKSSNSLKLKLLLDVIEKLNRKMLEKNLMLTTSIAHGTFEIKPMKEHQNVGKNPIYGEGYLAAFLDNENQIKKLKPGQYRLLKKEPIKSVIDKSNEFKRCLKEGDDYYYFYWMVSEESQIEKFNVDYKKSEEIQFEMMLSALKGEQFKID